METTRVAVIAMLAAGMAAELMAAPASAASLKVKVDSVKSGGMLPTKYAFCKPDAQGHVTAADDISPPISWSKGPHGTKSYAVILTDIDNPAEQREKMNKEGMTLQSSAKRRTVYHWVLVDIPANITSLNEGAESEGRVSHGKPATTNLGVRGLNSFTEFMANSEQMKGQYHGYDGPCPAWNDELVHRYIFTVYALSVPTLNLSGDFDGTAVTGAIKDKVLAEGKLETKYTTNPAMGAEMPR